MGDPVTQGQFFESMEQIRTLIDAKHSSMREYVGERSDKIEAAMTEHAKEDRAVEKRVTVIETERAMESRQALKRATAIGAVTAFVATGFWKVVEHFSR